MRQAPAGSTAIIKYIFSISLFQGATSKPPGAAGWAGEEGQAKELP